MAMNHAELVERGRLWLLQKHVTPVALRTEQQLRHGWLANLAFPCRIVFTESTGWDREQPDCFGFVHSRITHLIEVKTSVSDFRADKKKMPRMNPDYGLGLYRWYLMPQGMVHPLELPAKWGLLWALPNSIKIAKLPEPFEKRNKDGEAHMLFHEMWYLVRGWRNPDGSKGRNARW